MERQIPQMCPRNGKRNAEFRFGWAAHSCALPEFGAADFVILKSAVERGSFDQTMDEMDVVDPVGFIRKEIDFLVQFVHKVHHVQRIAHRIRS